MAMLLKIFKLVACLHLGEAAVECEQDDVGFIQRRDRAASCADPLPWPCGDATLSKFPLQAINKNKNKCKEGGSDICVLNPKNGDYVPVCHIPNVCLNACGVSPKDGQMYCQAWGHDGRKKRQLVQVNCPYSHVKEVLDAGGDLDEVQAKEGSVCYYGNITSSFAAAFDPEDGRFLWRAGKKILALPHSDLLSFTGSPEPALSERQVLDAEIEVRTDVKGIGVADFVVVNVDLNNDKGKQKYLVGCNGQKVQCVPLSSGDPMVTLTMQGSYPSGSSGAQWAFGDDVFCAYNNGEDGVIQVGINQVNNLKIPAGSVDDSKKTGSNDGLNCLASSNPFPPPTTTTTTTVQYDEVDTCDDPVSWPCGDASLASFALQAINRDKGKCESSASDIKYLNLTSGKYTPVCYIPNVCLNACTISPITSLIYCQAFGFDGNNNHRQLVRVNCPSSHIQALLNAGKGVEAAEPAKGSVCYYGKISSSYSASFDPDDGRYIWRSGSRIRALSQSNLQSFIGSSTPQPNSQQQVQTAEVLLRKVSGINGVADFAVMDVDLNNNKGKQKYLVGCDGRKVQCVPLTTNDPKVELTMDGSDPAGASGAQWAFGDDLYCAYNNGDDGVVEVDITQVNNLMVPTGSVSKSEKTNSNDGLNCLNGSDPFPPGTTTTTTTAGGHGDPHIETLQGKYRHYLMVAEGTYKFWRFKERRANWKVYAHYSKAVSMTEGLLFTDHKSGRVFEITAQDCEMRTKEGKTWRAVDQDDFDEEADFEEEDFDTTHNGIHVLSTHNSGQHRRFRLKFFLFHPKRLVATFKIMCQHWDGADKNDRPNLEWRPRIDVKVVMYNQDQIERVKGELQNHAKSFVVNDKPLDSKSRTAWAEGHKEPFRSQDSEFKAKLTWTELGGSQKAEDFLKNAPFHDLKGSHGAKGHDDPTHCNEKAAAEFCSKLLGGNSKVDQDDLAACVYDYCHGGVALAKSHADYREE